MTRRRYSAYWGAILITVGGLFMLSSLGLITIRIWSLIFPAFLVFWGLWVLIRIFTNPRIDEGEREAVKISLDGAERGCVHMQHRAGRLHVGSVAPSDQLVVGTFFGGVDYDVRRENTALKVDMRSTRDRWSQWFSPRNWWMYGRWPTWSRNATRWNRLEHGRRHRWSRNSTRWNRLEHGRRHRWSRMFAPWNWGGCGPRDWDIAINGNIPLDLSVEAEFTETQLDLGALLVTNLKMQTSMGATEVTLPAKAGHTRARFCATMGDIKVYVPEGVAARIHAANGWTDVSVNEGRFPRRGDMYQSPDYDSSKNKVEIEATSDMGTLTVI